MDVVPVVWLVMGKMAGPPSETQSLELQFQPIYYGSDPFSWSLSCEKVLFSFGLTAVRTFQPRTDLLLGWAVQIEG